MKTRNIILTIAMVLAMAKTEGGIAGNRPVPDDCRIIDDICFKFDASSKTALVSTYMTFSAEPWDRYDRYYTYKMTKLVIPATINIDSQEYTVTGFDNPFSYGTSPDTVVIPPTIVAITNVSLSNTKVIQLHNGIKEIGHNAFSGNRWLKEIELPDGLETIGDEAFAHTNLKSIHLPGSVKNLGQSIFYDCERLEEVVLAEGIPEIPAGMFYRDPIASISLPKTITRIGTQAFCECPLQSIVLPESLLEIGSYAFQYTFLSSIKFNDRLETIDDGAFGQLKGETLLDIVLPSRLKTIGQEAFRNSPVKTLTIPASVESIGEEAFAGCPLEKVVSLIEQPRYTPLPFQAFDDQVFLYTPLYVPTRLADEYRRVIYWNKFYDILEMDMSSLDRVTIDSESRYFTIDGREVAAPENGLYIIRKDGKGQKILKK